MSIYVKELSPSNDDEVIRFLDDLGSNTPSVLGYYYPFYRDMLTEIGIGQAVYFGGYINGELIALLPTFRKEAPPGVIYSSLPYFGPNAGVLCNHLEATADIHETLLQALLHRAKQEDVSICSIYTPFMFDNFDLYDSVMPEAIHVEKFTQYLELNFDTRSKNFGRNLRKARREGVQVCKEITAERIDAFYKIYEQNCTDYDISLKPKKCIELLVDEALIGKHTDIYFAYHEEEMIGGLLMIWSPLTASYYIPCTLSESRTLQAGPLLIDHALQDARTRGIRIWNWESSPARESGVFRFKKKWGSLEGSYRIYVQTFQSREVFQKLGRKGILQHYPNYFVYPFDLL